MNIEYIDAAAVAKMIRKDLKAAFPGTKFSVRKKGYNCVTINWTDGPASDAVMAVANKYSGGGFDGMIDSEYCTTSFISPTGEVGVAKCSGTEASKGVIPAYENEVPPGSRLVSFNTKYIFDNRRISNGVWIETIDAVVKAWGLDPEDYKPTIRGKGDDERLVLPFGFVPAANESFDRLAMREAYAKDYTGREVE